MEKFKGTPGPWYPVNYGGFCYLQTVDEYSEGLDILNEDDCKEAVHNAILAAAAPELLQALQNLVEWDHGTVNRVQAYKDAQSVINKVLNIEIK